MDMLTTPFLGYAVWLWLAFAGVVASLLAFDLGVLHREQREIGVVESLWLSAGYIGLRALYFALAAMIHRFAYLKYALALVLVFIGAKIFLVGLVGKIPAPVSLGVTFGLIAAGVAYSLWKTRGETASPSG